MTKLDNFENVAKNKSPKLFYQPINYSATCMSCILRLLQIIFHVGIFQFTDPREVKRGQSCLLVLKKTKRTVGFLIAKGFRNNLYFWSAPTLLFYSYGQSPIEVKVVMMEQTKNKGCSYHKITRPCLVIFSTLAQYRPSTVRRYKFTTTLP